METQKTTPSYQAVIKGFLHRIKVSASRFFSGDLVDDLGTLPIDKYDGRLSLSIRRHPGKPAFLLMKFSSHNKDEYYQVDDMRVWAAQFEKAAEAMRRELS